MLKRVSFGIFVPILIGIDNIEVFLHFIQQNIHRNDYIMYTLVLVQFSYAMPTRFYITESWVEDKPL